jgi:hypothetical protein
MPSLQVYAKRRTLKNLVRSKPLVRQFSIHRRLLASVLLAITAMAILAALVVTGITKSYAQSTVQSSPAHHSSQGKCTKAICTFKLQVNPGLQPGKTFACPAIQHAQARITITNRFVTGAQNDVMILTASGLPKNTGFDMFLVQNSPLDKGVFPGFGFGWYQSDVQSNSKGRAQVRVQGIFDEETFIENPAQPFTPIHTFNVGFWFDSPTHEQQVCGNQMAPAATPFNGEQHAGLLAMITSGEPLQFVEEP